MKVLLLQDVYKLGRAGDVKKVANGYGRNYLIPQELAVLATPGALKQADRIRTDADTQRDVINQEMSGVAKQLASLTITFPVRASEIGRLYGSINSRMVATAINEKIDVEISYRQIDSQPIRMIGEHKVNVRLTVDLIPEITVIAYREGESIAAALEESQIRAEVEIEDALEGEAEPEVEVEPEVETEPETAPVED